MAEESAGSVIRGREHHSLPIDRGLPMTNPFTPLVFDPVAPSRPGRALREVPEAERPRERLAQRGPAGLSAAELIALVWGTGARGMNAVDLPRRRSPGMTA